MHFLNAILTIALAYSSFSQQVPGYEWNKKSTFTTERQVEFPGMVLEPGVYIVRLQDSNEHKSVVEILNRDETQLLATVIAVPDHHQRPDDNSEFSFHAVKKGPVPVQTWYFSGDLVGLEFVYPKGRAKEIARDSDGHVMATNGIKDGALFAVTPNGKEVLLEVPLTQTARTKPQ